ncbi:MAG TPA: hypothetical protein VF503_29965 [Sphingobium sp.]|uniref:hypothetical protein n=1 Tax=Sphingobium sp. TaxID=1912891 RepID=UPI002ED1608E
MSGGAGASARLTQADDGREQDAAAERLGMSLQLLRASNLTMTRLHLALQSGDRRLAMMAMDGLLDIDAEIEGFVEDLVGKPDNDAHWKALTGYLEHQKAAIAAEKHALSGVVGRADAPVIAAPSIAVAEEFPVSPALPDETWSSEEKETPRPWLSWRGAALVLCGLAIAMVAALFALGWLPSR